MAFTSRKAALEWVDTLGDELASLDRLDRWVEQHQLNRLLEGERHRRVHPTVQSRVGGDLTIPVCDPTRIGWHISNAFKRCGTPWDERANILCTDSFLAIQTYARRESPAGNHYALSVYCFRATTLIPPRGHLRSLMMAVPHDPAVPTSAFTPGDRAFRSCPKVRSPHGRAVR